MGDRVEAPVLGSVTTHIPRTPAARKEGERIRLRHALSRLRAQLDGIDIALRLPIPIGAEVAQGVVNGALEIAMQISKHDAYDQAERDALPVTCGLCRDTHKMSLGDHGMTSCTRCPVPCEKCRGKNHDAYCALTPCDCACHARSWRSAGMEAEQ